jgi:hypothetical protein
MTRLERCELLKSKGYTYNPETGKIYGMRGQELISKNTNGYVILFVKNKPDIQLYGHHFAYYCVYGNVDFKMLDHINEIKSDNRIDNLRVSNYTQNNSNVIKSAKGYTWDKNRNKWASKISVNYKTINLGRFDTEEEARNAYLEAKKKYHICLADTN